MLLVDSIGYLWLSVSIGVYAHIRGAVYYALAHTHSKRTTNLKRNPKTRIKYLVLSRFYVYISYFAAKIIIYYNNYLLFVTESRRSITKKTKRTNTKTEIRMKR